MPSDTSAAKALAEQEYRIAVLGDSRVFDTYYATDAYAGQTYGYHKTFPHRLLRLLRHAEAAPGIGYDCVHIPDHFRGRTVQNNILRLALTDPDCVVLCDGIWESLLSRKHFAEHYEALGEVAPEYSDRRLTELFMANKLPLSPSSYGERIGRIVSWFIRRRRDIIWLTTPVPPKDFKDGLHYAGNYRPFDGWHDCLGALNAETQAVVKRLGGTVLDMDALMGDFGGAEKALIDQWHFTAPFHAAIAVELAARIRSMRPVPGECVSRRVIAQGPAPGLAAVLAGAPKLRQAFRARASDIEVAGEVATPDEASVPRDTPLIVLSEPGTDRDASIAHLVRGEERRVVLYPEELFSLDNPPVGDRSSFGGFK